MFTFGINFSFTTNDEAERFTLGAESSLRFLISRISSSFSISRPRNIIFAVLVVLIRIRINFADMYVHKYLPRSTTREQQTLSPLTVIHRRLVDVPATLLSAQNLLGFFPSSSFYHIGIYFRDLRDLCESPTCSAML